MALTGVVSYGRQLVKALLTGLYETTNDLYLAKARTVGNRRLHLTTASSGRAAHTIHVSQIKRKWVHGDDAYFIARHKLADVLGVADGVGGWRSYGVDPSKFSSTLMNTCAQLVQRNAFQPHRPAAILAASYYEILDAKQSLIGSCTACIVSFNHADSTLYSANLGDSGFVVVRGDRIVHRSREQQHYFNAPFQLAVAPPEQRGQVFADAPETAEQSSFSLQEGDIIIVGTDGLFDNMDDATLLSFMPALVEDVHSETIQQVADAIVRRAVELSHDPQYASPFSRQARANGISVKGGKPDDITLLLAKVTGMEAAADADSDADCADQRRAHSLNSVNDLILMQNSLNFSNSLPQRSASTNETHRLEDTDRSKRELFTSTASSSAELNVGASLSDEMNAAGPTYLLRPMSDVSVQSAAKALSGLRMCASAPSLLSLNTETPNVNLNVSFATHGGALASPRHDSARSGTHIFSLPLDIVVPAPSGSDASLNLHECD